MASETVTDAAAVPRQSSASSSVSGAASDAFLTLNNRTLNPALLGDDANLYSMCRAYVLNDANFVRAKYVRNPRTGPATTTDPARSLPPPTTTRGDGACVHSPRARCCVALFANFVLFRDMA